MSCDGIKFFDGNFNIFSPDESGVNDFYVIDSFSQEQISRSSAKVEVFLAQKNEIAIDQVYKEGNKGVVYAEPIRVNAIYLLNPIIQELTKFGIQEDNELTFKFNYTEMMDLLGREVQIGDWIRITIKNQADTASDFTEQGNDTKTQGTKRHFTRYYKVTNAIPDDNYLYNYLHWSCFAEMKFPDSDLLPNIDPRDIENTSDDDRYGNAGGVETNPEQPDPPPYQGNQGGGGFGY